MRVLVVAAHPDDEILGCGGSIARWSTEGHEVQIVLMAEGLTSRDPGRDPSRRSGELRALHEAARQAAEEVGAQCVEIAPFPDNRMDTVPLLEVVKVVEEHVDRFRPDAVFTHHGNDLNIDHRIVHQAVVTACRPLPGNTVRRLAFFEVPSSSEWPPASGNEVFFPNLFVDISATIQRKLQALRLYEKEMRPWPHPRSFEAVEHLARWRGAATGVTAAEAFVLGREIIR